MKKLWTDDDQRLAERAARREPTTAWPWGPAYESVTDQATVRSTTAITGAGHRSTVGPAESRAPEGGGTPVEEPAARLPSPEWGIGDDVRALCLCGHAFRMHGETGRCWQTVWLPRGDGTPDLEDPRYCGCDLFERKP